jgi:hypothetical protein
MSPWPFVIGAYAFALLATIGLVAWSWAAMRRAETDVESLRRE